MPRPGRPFGCRPARLRGGGQGRHLTLRGAATITTSGGVRTGPPWEAAHLAGTVLENTGAVAALRSILCNSADRPGCPQLDAGTVVSASGFLVLLEGFGLLAVRLDLAADLVGDLRIQLLRLLGQFPGFFPVAFDRRVDGVVGQIMRLLVRGCLLVLAGHA